jgi:HK97 family phage major capsid protein
MELKLKGTGGSLQSEFTGSDFPVSEWANEILGEALLESPIATTIQRNGYLKRNNKKTYFPISSATTVTNLWATGATTVRSATYETPLDLNDASIDPVEYRTFTPVANEVVEEMDGVGIEEYVRTKLMYHARRKIANISYTAMDDAALDSAYDWQTGGNALAYVDSNTAIDWGDSFTVDNLISGYETLITVGYQPTDVLVPPALYSDLFQESQFTNAAQYGSQNEAITQGKIPRFMGFNIILDQFMPDDSSDKDVAIMADWRYFDALLMAKDPTVKYDYRYDTGEHEFYMFVKAGAKVIHEYAAVAYYS